MADLPQMRTNPLIGRLEFPDSNFELRRACAIPGSAVMLNGHYHMSDPIRVADEVSVIGGSVSGYGFIVNGVSGVLFRGVSIRDCKVDGMLIRRSVAVNVSRCHFSQCGDELLTINGGSKDIQIRGCNFEQGVPRGVLIGNWQEPEDPPEEVFMIGCSFRNVPVRTPKINAAKVFLKDLKIEGYKQYGVHIEAGSDVHIHRLTDLGGRKAHGPIIAEHGAHVQFLDAENRPTVRWINPGEDW